MAAKLEAEKQLAEQKAAEAKAAQEAVAKAEQERQAAVMVRQKERNAFLKIQNAALGSKLPELKMQNRSYTGVAIKSIDDEGVSIVHAAGARKIAWADLSPEYQKSWGFDPARQAELEAEQATLVAVDVSTESATPPQNTTTLATTPDAGKETEKMKLAAEREAILRNISELDRSIDVAKAELKTLGTKKYELTRQYRREDSGAIKGAKTHTSVRQKNIGPLDSRIAYLEKGIASAKNTISDLKRKTQ
jgi:hypothetical protein